MVCMSVCGMWNNPWYTSTQFALSFPHNSIDWSHPVYLTAKKKTHQPQPFFINAWMHNNIFREDIYKNRGHVGKHQLNDGEACRLNTYM